MKKDVQKQFGENANSYVHSEIHKEGKDLAKLVGMAEITGQEEVLDIATGGGHTANAFAKSVKNIVALDLTPQMLVVAEAFIRQNGHQNVQFILGDAEDLPFDPDTFDIVTCRIAPHHFSDIKEFIRESHRVLKHGGQLLLDDNVAPEDEECDIFYNNIEKMRDYSHVRAWKKTEWLRMLELSGFETRECHSYKKVFLYDSWCQRMKLPPVERERLTAFILEASQKMKSKFHIQTEKNQIVSFQGEAFLLKAIKY